MHNAGDLGSSRNSRGRVIYPDFNKLWGSCPRFLVTIRGAGRGIYTTLIDFRNFVPLTTTTTSLSLFRSSVLVLDWDVVYDGRF